ncbi:hypothetical protein Tco_0441517 [Tanacetum coccineum]
MGYETGSPTHPCGGGCHETKRTLLRFNKTDPYPLRCIRTPNAPVGLMTTTRTLLGCKPTKRTPVLVIKPTPYAPPWVGDGVVGRGEVVLVVCGVDDDDKDEGDGDMEVEMTRSGKDESGGEERRLLAGVLAGYGDAAPEKLMRGEVCIRVICV